MEDVSSSSSAVFRQLRAAPSNSKEHASQLQLARSILDRQIQLPLPRKAQARALLEWVVGRCNPPQEGKGKSSAPSAIQDPAFWHIFADILAAKEDQNDLTSTSAVASTSSTAQIKPSAQNLLSKSDIRQIVLLARGPALFASLKVCLDEVASPALSNVHASIDATSTGTSELLSHLEAVFRTLLPLALSSPTSTLDGILPCVHAFIRSTGTVSLGQKPVIQAWNELGQLLVNTLENIVASTPSTDKVIIKKINASFLEKGSSNYANWKDFVHSQSAVLAGLARLSQAEAPSAARSRSGRGSLDAGFSKGKGKARQSDLPMSFSTSPVALMGAHLPSFPNTRIDIGSLTQTQSLSQLRSDSKYQSLEKLLAILDDILRISIFSQHNLIRMFSNIATSSGTSGAAIISPQHAQEVLTDLFEAMRSSMTSGKESSPQASEDIIILLPRIFTLFLNSVSRYSHELFSPNSKSSSQQGRNAGRLTSSAGALPETSSATKNRSAMEYQVQTAFRHTVFGFLRSTLELLRVLATNSNGSSNAAVQPSFSKKSPTKRPREEEDVSPVTTHAIHNKWAIAQAIKLMLRQLYEKNAYSAGGSEANRAWLAVLRETAHFCTVTLLSSQSQITSKTDTETDNGEITLLATASTIKAIATIAKLDFAAINEQEVLPDVFQTITGVKSHSSQNQALSSVVHACDTFMDIALSYNGKIRQLPSFISHIRQAVYQVCDQRAALIGSSGDLTALIEPIFRSPLLSVSARTRLAKECRASLGTTQIQPLIRDLLEAFAALSATAVSTTSSEHSAPSIGESTEQARKKSKKGRASLTTSSSDMPLQPIESQIASWKALLITQLLLAILTASSGLDVFANGATTTSKSGINQPSADQDEMARQISTLVKSYTVDPMSLAKAHVSKQRIMACVLQLQAACMGFTRQEEASVDIEALLQALENGKDCNPSLRYEIISVLLSHFASSDNDGTAQQGSRLFKYAIGLVTSVAADGTTDTWNGYSHCLTNKSLAIAIWWLISLRYLDVLERFALEEDLASVAKMVFDLGVHETRQRSEITLAAVIIRLLHSAEFFEQLRIRSKMTSHIGEVVGNGFLHQTHLDVLHLLPNEYLERPLKRRIATAIASLSSFAQEPISLRLLLAYTHDDPGSALIKTTSFLTSLATLTGSKHTKLVHDLYKQLWRLTLQNWVATPSRFTGLPSLLEHLASAEPASSGPQTTSLYLETWRILLSEVKSTILDPEILDKIAPFVHDLQPDLGSRSSLSNAQDSAVLEMLSRYNVARLVASWYQSAGQQAQNQLQPLDIAPLTKLARDALSALLLPGHDSSSYQACIRDALELASSAVILGHLSFETLAISYWLLAQKYDLEGLEYSKVLVQACKAQSEEAYRSGVSAMLDAISPDLQEDALANALFTLSIIVCHPPENASKVAAQAFSNSVRRISLLRHGRTLSSLPSAVVVAATTYIKTFLEQKIGVLELLDASSILSILQDLLSADEHTNSTSHATTSSQASRIFLDIVAIASILATHRRDLIIPLFSAFAMVLGSLLRVLRLSGGSAPLNGRAAATQFPSWSLSEQGHWQAPNPHGKMVSRLFLGLGTRTSVLQRSKTRDSGGAFQNASIVSLTGVLSKHAPFILLKYLGAVTDSKFAMSPAMRNELHAGILEVLGCLGKPEREAVMKAFLDTQQDAERTLLRSMWKDFDATRYKGD